MFTTFLRRSEKLLKFFDLFSYSSFIRYKGESQFKTATGGFFSIAVLIIFTVLFTNLGIKTFQRQIISSSFKVEHSPETTSTVVHLDPKNFMFYVAMFGINLNDPTKRWFDISMNQITVTGWEYNSSKNIELQPCTPEHFSTTQLMMNTFVQIPQHINWLCPKIGSYFQLFGKSSSKVMNYVSLQVRKCDPALDPTRPCVSQSEIITRQNIFGPFYIGLMFSNPLINPSNQKYLDFFFEESNYFTFSTELGVESVIYVEDYEIVTDNSILPYDSKVKDTGVRIQKEFKNSHYIVKSALYVNFMFLKSTSSTTYERSFYKIDQFFSYIGGLVGVIVSGMFLLSSYNQFSFEHDIAKFLYKKDKVIPNPNLCNFFMQFLFSIFSRCFPSGRFESLQKGKLLREEMEKQLDLSLILSRLLFLERSVEKLFDRGQFTAMHLLSKYTLDKARKMRKNMNLHCHFMKNIPLQNIQSFSSLNEGDFAENNLHKSIQSADKNHLEFKKHYDSDEQSNSSIDSEAQINLKIFIQQFKNSLKERNQRSIQIYSQFDENFLKLFVQNENFKQMDSSFYVEQNEQIYSRVIIKKNEKQELPIVENGKQFEFIEAEE